MRIVGAPWRLWRAHPVRTMGLVAMLALAWVITRRPRRFWVW